MKSPLLFPVKLKGKKIYVLDETKVPFKEEYIKVSNLDIALRVLESMKTRSLGQVLLFFYSCQLFRENFSIEEIVQKFKEKRPTFDFPLLGEMLKRQEKLGFTTDETVSNFVSNFDKQRKKRAKKLAKILPNPANILTICNINGELIYLSRELRKLNKEALFYVSETRPYLQGARLTFWELTANNVSAKLICDNQAAILMKEGKVNCVLTGADRATKKGDIINKIGTYSLARLAGYFNIPFYALIQEPCDIEVEAIEIEERPKEEVFMYLEGDSTLEAIYPCFDITKAEFITHGIDLNNNED